MVFSWCLLSRRDASSVGSWVRTHRGVPGTGCSEGVTRGAHVLLLHPNTSFLEARVFLQCPPYLRAAVTWSKLRMVSRKEELRGPQIPHNGVVMHCHCRARCGAPAPSPAVMHSGLLEHGCDGSVLGYATAVFTPGTGKLIWVFWLLLPSRWEQVWGE